MSPTLTVEKQVIESQPDGPIDYSQFAIPPHNIFRKDEFWRKAPTKIKR